jgi:nucleoside-diphosphate-sugar epimerase
MGPGDWRLLKLFRAIERGHFFMIGRGSNRRQCIHVNDLVRGLMLAAEHPAAVSETMIMAGPRGHDDERDGRAHRNRAGS